MHCAYKYIYGSDKIYKWSINYHRINKPLQGYRSMKPTWWAVIFHVSRATGHVTAWLCGRVAVWPCGRWLKVASCWPQVGLIMLAQVGSSWPQFGSSWPHVVSKMPQIGSSWPQVALSWPQVPSSWPQVGSRQPQGKFLRQDEGKPLVLNIFQIACFVF